MVAFEPNTQLLTLKEAATLCPYSAEYLNLLARKGKLRATKVGRDWLVTRTDLFDYLKKQQDESRSRLSQLSKYISLLM